MGVAGADIVKINGVVMTRARALARGFITADNAPTAKADEVQPKPNRGPVSNRTRKLEREAQEVAAPAAPRRTRAPKATVEPATTPDGLLKPTKRIEPLRPANLGEDGQPITDPEELDRIAAETAAIEAAAKAAREAGGVTPNVSPEPAVEVTTEPVEAPSEPEAPASDS